MLTVLQLSRMCLNHIYVFCRTRLSKGFKTFNMFFDFSFKTFHKYIDLLLFGIEFATEKCSVTKNSLACHESKMSQVFLSSILQQRFNIVDSF